MSKSENKEKKQSGAEKFGADLFGKLEKITGNWEEKEAIEITAFDKKTIYKSPEEPSHVAWVGLWREPNGTIKIKFAQITGNPGLDISYAPWYGRFWQEYHNTKSWEDFCKQQKILVGPPEAIETTDLNYITMESHDNGDTWVSLGEGKDARGYNIKPEIASNGEVVEGGMSTVICKNGRVLQANGNIKEWQKIKEELGTKGDFFIVLRESFDNGKIWTEVQVLPLESGKEYKMEGCEELAMVELSDGRMLVLIRIEKPLSGNVAQVYLRKGTDGTYTASLAEKTIMPHSGKPDMVKCGDGTIWYWDLRGHYYTTDEGKTWHQLPEAYSVESYYGKMIAAGENKILCVSQRDIGDSPYPHSWDGYIERTCIEYKKTCVVKQNENSSASALAKLKGKTFGNLHLKVAVKLDGAEGMAFGISPDRNSYFVFAVVRSEEKLWKYWSPPANEEQTLSAWAHEFHEDACLTDKILARPLAIIAKVKNGKITVLRGAEAPRINSLKAIQETPRGAWIQLQIKISGHLIQCSFIDRSSYCSAIYLGVNASEYSGGGVGLFTAAGSRGEFKNLCLWESPRMIRDLWD